MEIPVLPPLFHLDVLIFFPLPKCPAVPVVLSQLLTELLRKESFHQIITQHNGLLSSSCRPSTDFFF